MRVRLQDCTSDQLPALRAFIARTYGEDYVMLRDDALMDWQFRKGGSEHHFRIARIDEEIVGCLGFIPVEISLQRRVLRGAWLANWMIDAQFRELGLGPLLARDVCALADVTLVLGLSTAARELLPRMGWKDLGLLRRYVQVLDEAAVRQLAPAARVSEGEPGEALREGVPVRRIDRFPESMTAIWDAMATTFAGTRRTAAYMNWRYVDHPRFRYRSFIAEQAGICGVAVYRIEDVRNKPIRVGRIVELFGDHRAEASLAAHLVKDARVQRVAFLDFLCTSERSEAVLRRNGFVPVDELGPFPLLFQPLDYTERDIPFMAVAREPADVVLPPHGSWYVTKGDGDQDRPV